MFQRHDYIIIIRNKFTHAMSCFSSYFFFFTQSPHLGLLVRHCCCVFASLFLTVRFFFRLYSNKSRHFGTAIGRKFPAPWPLIGYTFRAQKYSVRLTNWNAEKAGLGGKRVGKNIIPLRTERGKSQEMTSCSGRVTVQFINIKYYLFLITNIFVCLYIYLSS